MLLCVCACLFFLHFEPYDRKLKIFFNQFPVSTYLFYFFDFTFLFLFTFFFLLSFFLFFFLFYLFLFLFFFLFHLFLFLFSSFFIFFLLFYFLFSSFFFLRISKAKQKVITVQYLNSTDRLIHSHVNLPQPQEIFSENKKKF